MPLRLQFSCISKPTIIAGGSPNTSLASRLMVIGDPTTPIASSTTGIAATYGGVVVVDVVVLVEVLVLVEGGIVLVDVVVVVVVVDGVVGVPGGRTTVMSTVAKSLTSPLWSSA